MKRRLSIFLILSILCFVMGSQVCAQDIPDNRQCERLVDEADLLSDYEEGDLLAYLNEISERQQFDVAVVTVNSLDGKSAEAYADDFYDYNGFGMGEDADGALLLVCMGTREWHVSTTGYGITAITDAGLDYMSEEFLPYLSDGEYLDAFMTYAQLCDEFVTQAREGEAYDVSNMPEGASSSSVSSVASWLVHIVLAVILGFVLAFIPMSGMKRQLKSVQRQNTASSYVKYGSVNISEQRDQFLYHTVHRSAKPKSNSGGGGSSTHVGSSGRSHGGGGGRF